MAECGQFTADYIVFQFERAIASQHVLLNSTTHSKIERRVISSARNIARKIVKKLENGTGFRHGRLHTHNCIRCQLKNIYATVTTSDQSRIITHAKTLVDNFDLLYQHTYKFKPTSADEAEADAAAEMMRRS